MCFLLARQLPGGAGEALVRALTVDLRRALVSGRVSPDGGTAAALAAFQLFRHSA